MKNAQTRRRLIVTNGDDVHVEQGETGTWYVTQGEPRTPKGIYRLRGHAMAFARAVAFSGRVEMIVHEINGLIVRHPRASLTYPISLN